MNENRLLIVIIAVLAGLLVLWALLDWWVYRI